MYFKYINILFYLPCRSRVRTSVFSCRRVVPCRVAVSVSVSMQHSSTYPILMELSNSDQTRRLLEASQTGNVQVLHHLLAENQLLLHNVPLVSGQSPLHVASVAGHVEFVKEILRLKPAFARELNQDGFSPMHIAAANGFLEIVRELLTVDNKLSQLKGRDQWTPLHYAASRGRVDIIREMILACPESAEDVTVQGETVLHLAVRNSQFEAARVLVELVRDIGKLNILDMKDNLGNTVLHLATWKKQHQVVHWLVHIGTGPACALDLNIVNQSGLTALDLLLVFPSEAGDMEMAEILRGAGALRARNMVHPSSFFPSFNQNSNQPNAVAVRDHFISVPFHSPENHSQMASETHQEQPDNLLEYFKFRMGRDSPSDARTALLVVAVLVATATFQVVFDPPGGLWQDTALSKNGTEPPHIAGTSTIASYYLAHPIIFAVFNSIGFSVSVHMINVLTTNFPLRLELQICGLTMYFTYVSGLIAISPGETAGWYSLFALTPVVPPLVLFAARWVQKLIIKLRKLLLNPMLSRII